MTIKGIIRHEGECTAKNSQNLIKCAEKNIGGVFFEQNKTKT